MVTAKASIHFAQVLYTAAYLALMITFNKTMVLHLTQAATENQWME